MSKRLEKRRGVCPPGLRQNTYRLFFCFSRKPFQALAGLRGFEQYSCIIKKASATKVADAFLWEDYKIDFFAFLGVVFVPLRKILSFQG